MHFVEYVERYSTRAHGTGEAVDWPLPKRKKSRINWQPMANEAGVEKEAIIKAIESLKTKGWDINPFTVGDEAKIDPSLIYRSSEFMALINRAKEDAAALELEQRLKETETRVRQLQIQNEVLQMQQQQQYDLGHKLGMIEARKALEGQPAAPAQPAPQQTQTPQPQPSQPNPSAAKPETVEIPAAAGNSQSNLDTVETPAAASPPQPSMPESAATVAQDVACELSGSFAAIPISQLDTGEMEAAKEKVPGTAGVIVQQAALSFDEWETPDVPEDDEPEVLPMAQPEESVAAHQPEERVAAAPAKQSATQPVVEAGFADSYSERVFNAARSGPFVASEFNPLIELSWKDLETVYHFRARTLKDISKNYASATGQNMPAMTPSGQVAARTQPPLPTTLPGDEPVKTREEQETTGPQPSVAPEIETFVQPQTVAPEAFIQPETVSAPEVFTQPEAVPAPEAVIAQMEQHSGPNGNADAQPQVSVAQTTGEFHEYKDPINAEVDSALNDALALGESLTQIEEMSQSPVFETVEPGEAESGLDLDSLDIFEGMDDYGNLEDIEIIQDVELKDEKTGPSDDELRDLIKNRIKQARDGGVAEVPKEGLAGMAGAGGAAGAAQAPAGKEAEAAKGLKSKFVGSKAAQGKPGGGEGAAAPPPAPAAQAGGFAARAIPPEIRKACLILGVRPEEMTAETVQNAWKGQIASPGVHPDLGGDTESAIFLNTAKDTLLRWLEQQAPKLGKKFGGGGAPKPGQKGPEK